MAGLRSAMRGMHSLLHDMRLTNDVPLVRYFVQGPTKVPDDALVKFVANSRPRVSDTSSTANGSLVAALDSLLLRIGTSIQPAAESLMALSKHLQMRVSFGQLCVRHVKRGTADSLTYDELPTVLDVYSTRGGADFIVK
jgi:hypothetical protein